MGKIAKKIKLSLITVGSIFSLASCGEQNYYANLNEKEIENFSYEQDNKLQEKLQCREICVELPENSEVSSYCIYEDALYYNVEYTSFFEDSVGLGTTEFTEKYCTQIRKYNIGTGVDELLYQYGNDYCMNVSDIQCNGSFLIWEDYPREKWWNLKCMDLATGQVADILDQIEGENGFTTITPRIAEEGIYWYNADRESNTDLFYYKFADQTVNAVAENIYLMSPYTRPSVVNDILTFCEKTEEGFYEICSLNLNTQEEKRLGVTSEVRDVMSNDKICAWMTGYETDDCKYIYVYNFESEVLEKIEVGRAFSFAIIDNVVIVNERGDGIGIYGYDVGKKTRVLLFDGSENYFLFTGIGYEGNVYAEQSGGIQEMKIIEVN